MKVLCTILLILSKHFTTACIPFALLTVCPLIAGGKSASYKVHLDLDRPLRATVEAELEAPEGLLFTAKHAGGYAWWAPPFQKSSLQSAVEDGGGDKDVNRPGIYNGGVVAAFCLDTMIQKQTAGQESLEDLLSGS